MTFNKDLFSIYKVDGGNVTLGNDDTCKVVGIDYVVIKMHDGMIRMLNDIRHVLGLKKNLISLGTLDGLGCRCSCKGGVMKIMKASLILMKGSMVVRFYVLQGSLVIELVNITTSTMSKQETKLLHMRLGHLSEQGMNVFVVSLL